MPPEPKYCAQCGAALSLRVVDDRPRRVCSECGHIAYQNPLPVAAAVVLNDQREVLLVKRLRDPHRGEWCLPMGFAEIGESIAQAALRELREETGVEGDVIRLLDSESYSSAYYGDLLIITYEVRKTGGHERAGDDAESAEYFSLERLPPLAFTSNDNALRACAAAHQADWAIHDSFVALQANEGHTLLSDPLVALIQEQAPRVARDWLDEVRSNPTTTTYRSIDPNLLLARATAAVSQFGRWLSGDEDLDQVKDFYRTLASERMRQGFGACELLSSLALLKKEIWSLARTQATCQDPIDMYRLLELSRRVAAFFDRATFQAMREFEGA